MVDTSTATINLYRSTPRMITSNVVDCLTAGLVPYIKGSPGIGKSALLRNIAALFGLWLIDHRVSTSDPTDVSGLPGFENGKAKFMPFEEMFPLTTTPIPKGYEGWLIFLDEFNSGRREVQAAFYKVLLDKMVGQHKLHPKALIVCAGNLDTDKAITELFSTAMQSRVVTMEMVPNYDEWQADVAIPGGYDHRIFGYLGQYPSKLMDFDPNHKEHTFCCPRTWEMFSRLIKPMNSIKDEKVGMLAGTITSGVAADFVQFSKVYQDLISVRDIVQDPENCDLPRDNATRWALITHIMEKIDDKNASKLGEYADRFPMPFRILFYRSMVHQHPKLRDHPVFMKAMLTLHKHLTAPVL